MWLTKPKIFSICSLTFALVYKRTLLNWKILHMYVCISVFYSCRKLKTFSPCSFKLKN